MGQEETSGSLLRRGPYFSMPHPFNQSLESAVQPDCEGYHFRAVYTKVSRYYPKSQ
jgi:hypothetical protein